MFHVDSVICGVLSENRVEQSRVGGKGVELRSSILIRPNGTQEPGFSLEHDIVYEDVLFISLDF